MMSRTNMWKCERCGAPNPQSSDKCYSCRSSVPQERTDSFSAPLDSSLPASANSTLQMTQPIASIEPPAQLPQQQFQQSGEPTVQPTGMDMITCRYCGGEVPRYAKKCMHCGEWLSDRTMQLAGKVVLYLFVAVGGFAAIFLLVTKLYYNWP